MHVEDALTWVEWHNAAFGDAPGTYGRSNPWIIRAGELCRLAVLNKDVPPVTDSDVEKDVDVAKPPKVII